MKIDKNIFKEYDIRGKYPDELDEQGAYALGYAFVLSQKAKKIVVTRDRRKESEMIMPYFLKGVQDAGCKIFNLGINSTPAMFFAVGNKKFDGGVSATASHNPEGYAGLKMCDKNGTLIGSNTGLKKIYDLAQKVKIAKKLSTENIKTNQINITSEYYQFANSIIDFNKIKGFKIVIDASNGSGAGLADYFFVRIHSKITKINFVAGDKYKDHGLNPMLAKNRTVAISEVKKQKADIGIIFDGDGDRCIFIDDKGNYISPYYINCLLSEIFLKKYKRIGIVIDARLPGGISEIIKNNNGKPIVSRAGYTNIIQTMQKKKSLFGCENSGHYFFNFRITNKKAKNFIFGDAIIPPLLILKYLRENEIKLSEAVAKFKKAYLLSGEMNFENIVFDKLEKKIEKKYSKNKIEKIDGISVYGENWFFNIRSSKTEPLVRLNIEAKNKKTLDEIKKEITSIIK